MTTLFDIDAAVSHIRNAVKPFPKAALFELFDAGFKSPFELLVACIISIRTLDEVMLPAAKKLFEQARTPHEMSLLSIEEIDALINASTFHERKSAQIRKLALKLVEEHNGELPCDEEIMLSMEGVGPKCANLVLGIACGKPRIGVDVHVHRIANRWGFIQSRTPEKSIPLLEAKLPQKYWVEINSLLVPFGKHICTGTLPRCSKCPISDMCLKVGVSPLARP